MLAFHSACLTCKLDLRHQHVWVCIRDYQHDGIHLYLIQQVFYRYSGTRLENDLIQQKNNLFFIINANQLCRHIMSLSLLQTKCPIIRNEASSSPSFCLLTYTCMCCRRPLSMCLCAFFMDRLQLSLEDAGFLYHLNRSNTHTFQKPSVTKKAPHSHEERKQ